MYLSIKNLTKMENLDYPCHNPAWRSYKKKYSTPGHKANTRPSKLIIMMIFLYELCGFLGMKLGMVPTNFGTRMKLSGRDLSVRVDPYEIDGSNFVS